MTTEWTTDSRAHASRRGPEPIEQCALPIVVGATGHRTLLEGSEAMLEERVASVFADLGKNYPRSPLIVLSPLAEGADRLVARVGLEHGARLVVPLPFELAIYEQDFTAPGSKEEFETLVSQAAAHFVLPGLEGHAPDAVEMQGEVRDLHYAQVGAYVARNCQILIALWNGDRRTKRGGTSDVVSFRLDGASPELIPAGSPLDEPVRGPVYHIVTPSADGNTFGLEPLSTRILYPDGDSDEKSAAAAHERVLRRIEVFNRDACSMKERLASEGARSRDWIAPAALRPWLDKHAEELVERYAVADALALHFGARSSNGLVLIVAGIVVAVLLFEIYAHFAPESYGLLGGYLAGILAVWLLQRHVRSSEYQVKHLDYRSLAEGLRIQLFWRIAGIREMVADNYVRKQRSVLDWIRNALQTWSIAAVPDLRTSEDESLRIDVVARHWVADQAAYFRRATAALQHRLHRLELLADIFFGGAIVVAVAWLAAAYITELPKVAEHASILTIGVCLVLAGVFHGYIGRRAMHELSRQYAQMAGIYAVADVRLREYRERGEAASMLAILRELGIEALGENGDWLILHRDRPIEMPKGH